VILFLAALVAGWIAGRSRGGRSINIARLRFPALPVLICAVIPLIVAVGVEGDRGYALTMAGFVLLGAWLLLCVLGNQGGLRLGLLWLTVGWMCNLVPFTLNKGMPVSERALAAIEQSSTDLHRWYPGRHVVTTPHTYARQLGDIIVVEPLHHVFSPGDVLIFAGFAIVIASGMRLPVAPAEPDGSESKTTEEN